MTLSEVSDLLTASPTRSAPTMGLIETVSQGLPLQSVDALSRDIAPDDAAFKYVLIPKATYNRRRVNAGRKPARLSKDEGERLVRLARVWAFANEVWGSPEAARRFMFAPHMLLDGRTPLEVSLGGELGGKMVEEVLGRLAYGSAA
jgi:putative toxin-antitoxin system antitoxin component (TIGR02293 family)